MAKFDWRHWFKKKEHHGYEAHPSALGKAWHFLAHEDSLLSFVADAILVIIIGKFIVLPALGFALGTSFPLVAVVSGSMEHHGTFDEWWAQQGTWYEKNNITKEEFSKFPYYNGFNKGDVFAVKGVPFDELEVGDVIVYLIPGRRDPIIHRIVDVEENFVITKGDANAGQLDFELAVSAEQIQGVATVRIPLIGWVKVAFVELMSAGRKA